MKGARCSRQTPEPTFKANDGVAPMQLHCAGSAVWSGDVLTLDLAPRLASCKPCDRWLEAQQAAKACCSRAL